jgi:outer membrane lipoprotein LolB
MRIAALLTQSRTTAAILPAAALALLIAGCSSLRPQQEVSSATSSLAPRTPAGAFTASGRVAARVAGDSSRGFSGGFSWAHRPAGDTVELMTPLGQLAARMTVTRAGATIELPDGRATQTSDPEQFLSDNLGIALPLASLPNWLQGIPVAGAPYRAEAVALGRPVSIWQNGWQIQYTAYSSETADANPARLTLSQGDAEARMIISEWTLQP